MQEQTLTTACTSSTTAEPWSYPCRGKSSIKIPQISNLEQTLHQQENKLAFIMQFYQLHTVGELVTWQCFGDHISKIVIIQNLQHLDFSMLDYLCGEMQPHIDVLGSLVIGRIL